VSDCGVIFRFVIVVSVQSGFTPCYLCHSSALHYVSKSPGHACVLHLQCDQVVGVFQQGKFFNLFWWKTNRKLFKSLSLLRQWNSWYSATTLTFIFMKESLELTAALPTRHNKVKFTDSMSHNWFKSQSVANFLLLIEIQWFCTALIKFWRPYACICKENAILVVGMTIESMPVCLDGSKLYRWRLHCAGHGSRAV
jgi:hypothetical protein